MPDLQKVEWIINLQLKSNLKTNLNDTKFQLIIFRGKLKNASDSFII